MGVALVTGSAGLIGSEAARHFAGLGMHVVGIDNDMRRYFFGPDGSTVWSRQLLISTLGDRYTHYAVDIRDLGLPLLVMHSPTDETVDISNAGEIFRTARHPRSFVSLEGSDHLLTARGQAERAARIISAWADQYLAMD